MDVQTGGCLCTLGLVLNAGGVVQSQECWRRRGGDKGGSRGDVEVAGTGGETAGGEVVREKNVLVRGQVGFIIRYLHDS